MSVQVEVRCPLCNGIEFAPLAKAVTVSRGPGGVKDVEAGRTYGCLRCGGNLCVTRGEVFAPNRALQRREPETPPVTGRRVTRNGDRDILMTPEQMT